MNYKILAGVLGAAAVLTTAMWVREYRKRRAAERAEADLATAGGFGNVSADQGGAG